MSMQVLIALARKLEHRFRPKELLEGSCILLPAVGVVVQLHHDPELNPEKRSQDSTGRERIL